MTKKFEDKESAQNIGHYYIKEHFVKFKEPIFLKKKQAQKTIEPKFKSHFFYTEDFTEVYEPKAHRFVDERLSWYDAIENGDLKPSIDRDGNVRLFTDGLTNSQYAEWCEQIELIASKWIERECYRSSLEKNGEHCENYQVSERNTERCELYQASEQKREYCRSPQVSRQDGVDLILQALAQLARYLPDLQEKQPNYFLDIETYKIGVTLQGEGTVTLLIGKNSEVEYSYAQRQEKGTIRISGIAKLTTNVRNSKNIWKILNLQGIVK
ncbi:hypothetical protein ACRCO3_29175 [Pseudomonas aeruginosa]|uniref:hypothetical protein n=1 Tax=Pseudomonas TaxID=286 RepID=UPI0003B94549|nr:MULTISPECIES: hypothetical protein [Pseudomonas]ELP1278814.1 hypothetical protein [Pseudomonas aeruginosa]ELP1319185.1 hypothetical protein [Pseudomonas aeruginosa]ERX90275.1 hypothetical protein Q083_00722 [Pseudomonas aeruginosa M8A.4]MBA6430427.1 hypothetical protein [Pseudomonas aeruginosa]MBG4892745.1 hypothetical protein [Pseudomonas aeruginosa]